MKNPLRETTQDAEVGTMPTVELPTLVPLQVGKPARKEEAIPIDFGNEKCLENHLFKKRRLLLVF